MNSSRLRNAVLVSAAGLFIFLRFWRLTDSCLWFDEVFTVHAAEQPWSNFLQFIALDLIHPPLFYAILKIWISVGGDGLFWLRVLPVLFSIVSLVPFMLFCREIGVSMWNQVLALFLISVNGAMISYSREVRMYSALVCLSLFSMWLFSRFFNRGNGFAALLVVNIALVYTQYFGWLVVLSELVAVIIFNREKVRQMAAMIVSVFVAFLPWLVMICLSAGQGIGLRENIDWIRRPGGRELRVFLIDLVEPFYFQATTADPVTLIWVAGPILFITLAASIIYVVRWRNQPPELERIVLFLLVFAVTPLITAFAASWILPLSVWGTRHLLIVFVPVSLLIANAFTTLPAGWVRFLLIALLLGYKCYGLASFCSRPFVEPVWCGYDRLSRQMSAIKQAPIYAFDGLTAYHVWFDLRKRPDILAEMPIRKIDGLADVYDDRAFFIPRGFDGVTKTVFEQANESDLWILFRSTTFDIQKPPLRYFAAVGYRVEDTEISLHDLDNIYAVWLTKRP
jgi:hypothetical protein